MAVSFANTKGKAVKSSYDAYEYKDGENTVRLVGGVLPRYVYWLKGTNGKDIPVECLAFNREKEKFDNLEKDWVPEYFPDKKCSWAYSINCIDPKDGRVKVMNLKKKLFEEIINLAADMEADPTDPDEGFDIVFKRQKTGPMPFNVSYTLSVLKCKKRPLTDDERAAVAAAEDIDTKIARPTPEEVKATLDKMTSSGDDTSEDTPEEAKDL